MEMLNKLVAAIGVLLLEVGSDIIKFDKEKYESLVVIASGYVFLVTLM